MHDDLFDVTEFNHASARFKIPARISLEELAEKIDSQDAERKDLLPWIKFAVFGDMKSDKGSLRWDGNVLHITGCECDYDAGEMSVAEAVQRLQAANIECIVHTSPSHSADKPRWRVLAPTSKPLAKDQRARLVARINGVLGGIVSAESFTLSQSYYYGHLNGGEHQVTLVNGRCIDQCNDLDAGAIGKGGHSRSEQPSAWEQTDIDELTRRILSGESLHPTVGTIAGSYAARGIPIDACLDYVALAFTAAHQPRYGGRWDEVETFIRWVYDKERLKQPPPEPAAPPASVWITGEALTGTPAPAQEWSVRDLIPAKQVCLFSGHGAVGKSSTALHLAAAHALKRAWLRFDPTPGPAFFIDAEDDLDVIHRRLDAILAHYEDSAADLADLHILSLAGKGAVMATSNRNGIVEPTALYRDIYQRAGDLKPQQIVIASSANVFAGSEMDRSQVTQFIDLLTKLAIVTGGSVILISHPSLTGLNTNSGISGSTSWHNAVRARFYMKFIKNGDDTQDSSDLRVLEFQKNQYGPPAQSLTLRFRNGLFLVETDGVSNLDKLAREAKAEQKFRDMLKRMLDGNRPVSAKPTSRNYAPTAFAREPDPEGLDKRDFENAMKRLFAAKSIAVKQYGKPANGWERIEFV